MLEVKGLTLKYGQSQILYDVDLSAEAGKVTAVMGTNGVGKTSLLKAISGRHPYDRGKITLDGQPLVHASATACAQAGIALVPQGRQIFPLLSVTENMETAFACLPRGERGIPARIYELFPVLKEMANRRGGDLSGGQQQQLAIARALITRPKVLLLDEPTEGIQPNIIKQIGHVISQLRDEGEMAVVLVEQFFDFAYELADSFVAIRRGAVEMSEPRSEVDRERLLACVTI
ncbi:urea ABC transporter ATP-binding subunit UrtE [Pseudoroseicyclus sp. H15]